MSQKHIVLKLIILIALGCASFYMGCTNTPLETPLSENISTSFREQPDIIAEQYSQGIGVLGSYQDNPYPGLHFDSTEVWCGDYPPYICSGMLFIYFNKQLVDSIPYGNAYHGMGVVKPSIQGGYITAPNTYLLKVQNERNQMYGSGKSTWYLFTGSGAVKLPKVSDKSKNGLYENSHVNFSLVRKYNEKLIFFGAYYCTNQTYCSFDLTMTFKNYVRKRSWCYGEWEWE